MKRALALRKVGHTGTLDPFASGLLVAMTGYATRLARYFSGLSKTYEAVFTFGSATDTDDLTGVVIEQRSLPSVSDIRTLVHEFTGTFEQVPPRFSAIHIDGRRAYEIAREGTAVSVPRRTVTVEELTIVEQTVDSIAVRVRCSAGTYIRSIARDLGAQAGSCAHVSALRRIAVGPFSVQEAVLPQAFTAERNLTDVLSALGRLHSIRLIRVEGELVDSVMNGKKLAASAIFGNEPTGDRPVALHDGSQLLAVVRAFGDRCQYDLVVPHDRD